jgi:hypothetical protein
VRKPTPSQFSHSGVGKIPSKIVHKTEMIQLGCISRSGLLHGI